MSQRYQRTLSLSGIDTAQMSEAELRALVAQLLKSKIHGLSFSPYVEGQGPGTQLTDTQIRERLAVIQSSVRWIRTFSCTDGHELIPAIAHEQGLKTMVGVWLDDDLAHNDLEIDNAIAIARSGHTDIIAVGNEVLLRDELSEDALLNYMHRVKAAAPQVPVAYVDAYFKFVDHPRVTERCDIILANCYPFWEGCPAEHALLYMKEMYRRAIAAGNGKRVIISETGWPNTGTATEGAIPSWDNAVRYLINTYQWAAEEGIDVFYFSAFDENWKVGDEGDVGANWGLWDKDGCPKYA
ncbi:MAG: glycosyl hydrolase family 17 protein [Pseudomonadota bacterium]